MHRRLPAPAVGLCVLLCACSPSGRDLAPQAAPATAAPAVPVSLAPSTAASATPSAIGTATPAAPRPPSAPATVVLRSAMAVEPAARLPLTPGVEVVVHPGATFEVELSARCPDARLVLVDARDDLVASTSTREVGGATRLTLSPAAPLVPASRYVLRLDGASDRDLHDDAGRAFSAIGLPLLAAGSPPPPEPKRPSRRKKRP